MRLIKTLLSIILISGIFFAWGCGADKEKITVGSKIDTEGALLGKIIVLMLEGNGYPVEDRTQFGPTNMVRKAIQNDQIDIYPEYTGNGGFFFQGTESSVWKDFQKGYETVKKLDKEEHNIIWLTPAPANNTWALAIREDLAKKENIKSMSDFAKYVREGGKVKVAASEEFVNRPDALPAFQQAYGFKLTSDQLVVLSGGNTAQTEKAAAEQINGVNVAMAYGTDGALAALGLKVLEDDKGVQPVYAPAPIIREEVLAKYPEIGKILEPVFKSLDRETLQGLNAQIAIEGKDPKQVAKDYLSKKGWL
jgi:osmoprotectant transport system substrate-binding protein